jgi:hypothetical protein
MPCDQFLGSYLMVIDMFVLHSLAAYNARPFTWVLASGVPRASGHQLHSWKRSRRGADLHGMHSQRATKTRAEKKRNWMSSADPISQQKQVEGILDTVFASKVETLRDQAKQLGPIIHKNKRKNVNRDWAGCVLFVIMLLRLCGLHTETIFV